MFVFGMILGLPGTVLGLPETVEQFGLTLADRGVLIAALFAGLLLGMGIAIAVGIWRDMRWPPAQRTPR